MKRTAFVLLCLLLALTLAGCATVNRDNSFQDQAAGEIITQQATDAQGDPAQTAQPVDESPTAAPTQDPNGTGFNG